MSININKIGDYEPVNANRSNEIKRGGDESLKIDGKNQAVGDDKVELSGKVSEAGKYVEKLKELPDVREDLVEFFRDKVSSGDYNPTSVQIADAIIKDEQ